MKIACVCSGWHFPHSFYAKMTRQIVPNVWEIDFFCISHRDPKFAKQEKKGKVFGQRAELDRRLYDKIASKTDIKKLGWAYIEKPNTIGDFGNINQWLEDYDYKKYDLFLFSHDDNLILGERLFLDVISDESFKDWHILCNSVGMPAGSIRGSFEFYKPLVLDKLGGKFDLSEVKLTREGKTETTEDIAELYDWNATVFPLQRLVEREKLSVGYLSPAYRVSAYCIEGERGYISNTHGANTEREEYGLKYLKEMKII